MPHWADDADTSVSPLSSRYTQGEPRLEGNAAKSFGMSWLWFPLCCCRESYAVFLGETFDLLRAGDLIIDREHDDVAVLISYKQPLTIR